MGSDRCQALIVGARGFGREVRSAAIYFLSDTSRWVTGTALVMDGGLTAL
ncbi:SDR family oxidoreductase [Pseudorhodoferax soli]|nr:SDR family oxidoreductase [Pseudorhodoferax soli]